MMKQDRLRQSLVCLLVGLVIFALVSVSWAGGVEVEVPYAVTSANWWTGVAVKNLDRNNATGDIKMEFFDSNGEFMGAVDIGLLAPLAIYSDATSNIYHDPLPGRYSLRVSHSDEQELAVTVFVGNSATGGFAYQTYKSQACCQTPASSSSWDQILPAADRFELVMYVNLIRGYEAVLDRETGLVWQRETNNSLSLDDAIVFCYNAEIGGRKGWRLPTVEELATLIDPTRTEPSLPDNHLFTNTQTSRYWSSTINAYNALPWSVDFGYGFVQTAGKGDCYYIRAVRSGQ